MNLSELPSHLPPLVGVDAGAVQASSGRSVSAQLHAASGNQLLELDVWRGASAADRVLNTRAMQNAPSTAQLDQLANHILAPLG
jgi:hypothetical protein